METLEIIKQAQAENLVTFEAGVKANVLARWQDKIQDYKKTIGDQVTAYFKYKEE